MGSAVSLRPPVVLSQGSGGGRLLCPLAHGLHMLMFGTHELRVSLVCRTTAGHQIVAVQSPSTAVKCLPWKGLVVHVHPPWNEKWVLIRSIPLPIGGRRIHPQKQRSEQERDHHSDHCGGVKFASLTKRSSPPLRDHRRSVVERCCCCRCCRMHSVVVAVVAVVAIDCCRSCRSCRLSLLSMMPMTLYDIRLTL